ncbi:MAG TPA: hypothetical protein VNR37_08430 [Microbacteriaceae bacterium]|nr:hypothetical protein [Microbacteriaceae bacterium]
MTSTVASTNGRASGWRGLVAGHRPLVVLLPLSLALSWTIALAHGTGAVPPASQGLLAGPLTAVGGSPALGLLWWLWLAGALVLLESTARRFGARDLVVIAIGAVLAVSPVTFWAVGWAGSDGPLLFFGALAIWLATQVADGRASSWWLVPVALVAGVFGVATAAVFLIVLIQLIGVAVVRGGGWRQLIGAAVVALAASIVLPLIAAVAGIGSIPGTPPETGGQTLGPIGAALGILNAMVDTGLGALSHRGVGLAGAPEYFYVALGWVIVAGVVIAFFQARRSQAQAPLVVAVAAVALLTGPLLLVLVRAFYGEWLVLQPLGVAVLLPAFLVVTSTVIRNRGAAWLVIAWSGAVAVLGVVLAIVATG